MPGYNAHSVWSHTQCGLTKSRPHDHTVLMTAWHECTDPAFKNWVKKLVLCSLILHAATAKQSMLLHVLDDGCVLTTGNVGELV